MTRGLQTDVPKDGKHRFTERQHRMAMYVKSSMKERGKSEEEAERIGWAKVASRQKKKRGLSALRSK